MDHEFVVVVHPKESKRSSSFLTLILTNTTQTILNLRDLQAGGAFEGNGCWVASAVSERVEKRMNKDRKGGWGGRAWLSRWRLGVGGG